MTNSAVPASTEAAGRPWEGWHDDAAVDAIDRYWQGSDDEAAHRARLAETVADIVGDRAPDSVLEVGCGTGLVYEAMELRIPGLNYTGCDISGVMLTRAHARFTAAKFDRADAYELPYEDKVFEVTVCFEVLGHIPDVGTVIAELCRVANRWVVFTVWPAGVSLDARQPIDDVDFLYRYFSSEDLLRHVAEALPTRTYAVDVAVVDPGCFAYIIDLNPVAGADTSSVRSIYPVPRQPTPTPFTGDQSA
jgi:SAM-dependent methyltransferase